MKRLINISLLLALLLGATTIFAQPRGKSPQPPLLPDEKQIEQMVEELAESVQLTDSQKSEVLKLFKEHFETMGKMMKPDKGGGQQHREQMEKIRAEFEAKVKALLNDEQKKGFEKFMSCRGHASQGRKPGRR